MNWIELNSALFLLSAALILFGERFIPRLIRSIARAHNFLAQTPRMAVAFIGISAFLLSAIFSAIKTPVPSSHDEFAYLLGADTFAHGRLSNRTPPFTEHFEAIHVLMRPTYASKYPPGHSFFLAAGQVLTGNPLAGVWIEYGLASAALCWLLYGWLPRRWALLGAWFVTLQPNLVDVAGHSYLGAGATILGGALAFGALPRVVRSQSPADVLLLAMGIVIMAITRPAEGAVATLCLIFWLATRLSQVRKRRIIQWSTLLLPAIGTFAAAGILMGIYFRAVTGSPTTLPYTLYHKAYSCPVFIWQSGWPQVEYSNKEFTEFFQREAGMFENSRTLHGWLANVHWMLSELFQGAGLLLIPLAALPFAWRRSGVRFGIATGLFVPLVDLLTPWFWWRYWLPALGMFSVASVQCTRHLRLCRVGRWRWGITMVHALLLCTTLSLLFRMAYNGYSAFRQRGNPVGFERRYRIQQQFQASGRKHLIIVHYRSGHSPNQDWIGNGADFDSDPVLWARDLSPESNDRLVQYFKGREAWWVDADAPQLEVVSYSEAKEKLRSRP